MQEPVVITSYLSAVIDWLISFFGDFFDTLKQMPIAQGVSVASLLIVMGIFLLVVSNLVLIAKRN